MSHPPTGGIAPMAAPAPEAPAATAYTSAPPTLSGPPAPPGAPHAAWREALDRLRAAAVTEPGRLRAIGALLAALLVVFGALTAWQVADRSDAAEAVVERSQPLSADAADIYRSLADADTTVASGFLADGPEPRHIRKRYDQDIALASKLLVKAAANSGGSPTARARIDQLNRVLPIYTGLVESARANERQGLPLGGAYLRYANDTMRERLLPAASELYEAQSGQLQADYDDAKAWPWVALGVGALALGALVWAQRRNYRRTNRVFNLGLLAATAATAAVVLWLVVGHSVARAGLSKSDQHAARSLRALSAARIAVLQARGDENLTLVARGAVVVEKGPDRGKDAYEVGYNDRMQALIGASALDSASTSGPDASSSETAVATRDSLLGRADALADNDGGRGPVAEAIDEAWEWQRRHGEARKTDDQGDYEQALAKVTGGKGSTGESFDRVDDALARAIGHEQGEFKRAADDGRGLLNALPIGAAVLAVLGAVGTVLGVGRRLSEYR